MALFISICAYYIEVISVLALLHCAVYSMETVYRVSQIKWYQSGLLRRTKVRFRQFE